MRSPVAYTVRYPDHCALPLAYRTPVEFLTAPDTAVFVYFR